LSVAETGEQALDLVGKEPFDLLVLDIMLPDISGLELCRCIRGESDAIILFAKEKELLLFFIQNPNQR
jgi:DNA-binding response OmpR family regulator